MEVITPVTITEKAAEEVKNIFDNKNIPQEYKLRIGVKGGGGCGGFSYLLGFDKKKEGDQEYELAGIPILVEKKHMMYLLDLEVDFHEGSDARGFTFVKKSS